MPRAADIPEISQIFLSATAQDCREYREAVRDFVQANEPAAKISLQEDWAAGGEFVVDVCQGRVTACDAYMLSLIHISNSTPVRSSASAFDQGSPWPRRSGGASCHPTDATATK